MKIKFKDIILEEVKSSACAKKFGDFLFGEFIHWYGDKKENDTELEKKYFQFIRDWINGSWDGDNKPVKVIDAFKELKKCMSSYPDVLQPKSNVLYRAISIDRKKFENNIKENNDKYLYIPKFKADSWTIGKDAAIRFGKKVVSYNKSMNEKVILLKAKFSKSELLFNANFLQTITNLELGGDPEWEIIRIGNKPKLCEYEIITG